MNSPNRPAWARRGVTASLLVALTMSSLGKIDSVRGAAAEEPRRCALLMQEHKFALAQAACSALVQLLEAQSGPDSIEVAVALETVADANAALRRFADAVPFYQRALPIRESKNGARSMEAASVLQRMAFAYVEQGQYEPAEPLLWRWVDIADPSPLPVHQKLFVQLVANAQSAIKENLPARAALLLQGAVALSDRNGGPDQPRVRIALTTLGEIYESQGDFPQAEKLFERALDIVTKTPHADRQELSICLFSLAGVLRKEHKPARAEELYRRAITVTHAMPGTVEAAYVQTRLCVLLQEQQRYTDAELPCRTAVTRWEQRVERGQGAKADHDRALQSRANLAMLLSNQRRYEEAEKVFLRLLADAKRTESTETPVYMSNLAGLYKAQTKYDRAEKLYKEAVELAEVLHDQDTAAICHNNLAGLKAQQSDYPAAKQHAVRALEIFRSIVPLNQVKIAHQLSVLGQIDVQQGVFDEAENLLREALVLQEKELGPDHFEVAQTRNGLAVLYKNQGNYVSAEAEYWHALTIYMRAAEPNPVEAARVLSNLAVLLSDAGQPARAESLARQALDLRLDALGKNHPDYADSLNTMAHIYHVQGDYAQALALYQQALQLAEQAKVVDSIQIANYENNLAAVLQDSGKFAQAEAAYEHTLAINQRRLGPDHPAVAESYINLGSVSVEQGELTKAAARFQKALDILSKKYPKGHPTVAIALNNLGLVYSRQGDLQRAEPLFGRALTMIKSSLGAAHPSLSNSLNNLAMLQLARGQLMAGLDTLHQSIAIQDNGLRAVVSEPRALALLSLQRGNEDLAYGLLLEHEQQPEVARLAMALTLLRKGRSLEVGSWASQAVAQSLTSPEQRRRFKDWQAARQQRERLLFLGPASTDPAAHEKQLRELELRAAQLEHELTVDSSFVGRPQPPELDQAVARVAKQLPPGSVLLEVVQASPINAAATGGTRIRGEPEYVALLLKADESVSVTRLGPLTAIDQKVAEALTQLSVPTSTPEKSLNQLYGQVFARLDGALKGTSQIYLSLDGSLNLLPWDALYDGTSYLIDRYEFHYVSSGRDLLRLPRPAASGPPLILADPDYGTVSHKESSKSPPGGLYALMQRLEPLQWAPIEAKEIGTLLGVSPRLHKEASEQTLRTAPTPSVLHIATHGVFLVDDNPISSSLPSRNRAIVALDPPRQDSAIVSLLGGSIRDPLNRSALALAGAAHAARSHDTTTDGVLTADEVRTLKLWGTELVTLSACETARGTVAVGQGVYGLRRAFLIAGAEALVSSLWAVADEETSLLMTAYYRRLVNGRPRISALRDAMLEVKGCKKHPHYWAPFIAIGRDAPLSLAAHHRKVELQGCAGSAKPAP